MQHYRGFLSGLNIALDYVCSDTICDIFCPKTDLATIPTRLYFIRYISNIPYPVSPAFQSAASFALAPP